jgi:glycosyltransferase involved in cell wall biosynthesis
VYDGIESKIKVIPNGVDVPSKLPSRSFLRPLRILYLSNLIVSKGYLDVLRAIDIVVNTECEPGVHLTICGKILNSADDETVLSESERLEELQDFISSRGLQGNISYVGIAVGDTKTRLLTESHLFILPTYYYVEALPISILEAMANGSVVITTNFRGIPDMISDGVTGVIVPPKSPGSIANAIIELLRSEKTRELLATNAYELVGREFTFERNRILLDELFRL